MKSIKIKYWVYIYLLSVSSLIFASDEPTFRNPKSTPEEILIHVRQFFFNEKISIDEYNLSSAIYLFNQQRWMFLFDNKDDSIGDEIDVGINDNNLNEIKFLR